MTYVNCFKCGHYGHWAADCPQRVPATAKTTTPATTASPSPEEENLAPRWSPGRGDYPAWATWARILLAEGKGEPRCPIPGTREADYAEWGHEQLGPASCAVTSGFRQQQRMHSTHECRLRELAAAQVAEARAARLVT